MSESKLSRPISLQILDEDIGNLAYRIYKLELKVEKLLEGNNEEKKIKAWVAISPEYEGSNIYLPGGNFAIYETLEQAESCGWIRLKDRIVPCTITYEVKDERK